jgi:hypothetical protein
MGETKHSKMKRKTVRVAQRGRKISNGVVEGKNIFPKAQKGTQLFSGAYKGFALVIIWVVGKIKNEVFR